jgi:hypothetical protein
MRWKGIAVGIVVALVGCSTYIVRRATSDGVGLFLSHNQRTAVVVTALLQFLDAQHYGQGESPTFLQTSDETLTREALEKLAESGRPGILSLVEKPLKRYTIIIVSRVNS